MRCPQAGNGCSRIDALARGHQAAGAPRFTPDRLASYEQWDDTIRQAAIWLGKQGIAPLGDPTAATDKAKEQDPERQKLAAFLELCETVMGSDRWRTGEIIAKASTAPIHPADDAGETLAAFQETLMEIAGERNVVNPRILGRWIEKQAERRVGGLRLVRAGELRRALMWRVDRDA